MTLPTHQINHPSTPAAPPYSGQGPILSVSYDGQPAPMPYATGGNFLPPRTFQTPIEQSRALRLVSPFKTGFLVGLGIICASLVPFGILLIIVASVASNQTQTF